MKSNKKLNFKHRVLTRANPKNYQNDEIDIHDDDNADDAALVRIQDENSKLRSKLKELQRENTLFKSLSNVIKTQPPFSTFAPYRLNNNGKTKIKESAVLMLSDSHGDQEILGKRVQNLEEYNFDVACKRAERIVDTTISHLIDNMKNYKFERLYVFGLGDYVNGDIHKATEHSRWKNSIKNAMGVGELFSMMITDLSRYFPEIVFVSVSGNHGRKSIKKNYRGAQDNWDYLVAMHTATRLSGLVEQGRLKFIIPDSWSAGVDIYGWNFLLNHGDDIRCFLPGSPITTDKGYVLPIENIEKGMKVLCSDGQNREVEETFCYDHSGDIVNISAECLPNDTWKVTPNHEVLVLPSQKVTDKYIDTTPEWIPAGHVSVGDYLVVPKPKVEEKDIINQVITTEHTQDLPSEYHPNEKKIPDLLEVSEELGYIIGQYLADGSIFGKNDKIKGSNFDNIVEVSYNSEEEEDFWNEFVDSWKKVFNDEPSVLSRKDLEIRCQRVHAYGQRAASLIKALAGVGSHTKILHEQVLKWPVNVLNKLLIGYLRGDGHTRRHMFHDKWNTHRVNASTCSVKLGYQLFWIARRCGYTPSIKTRTRSGVNEAVLGFYGDDARLLGPITQRNYVVDESFRKQRRSSFSDGEYFFVRVTKAYRSLYEGKKYDFAVKDQHDYTVNGAVVHNSWNSIPFYGIERKTRRLNAIGAVKGVIPNYFLYGHFHTSSVSQHTNGEVILNGSWAATDEYALEALGAYSEPYQWLFGVHPKYGISWRLPIKLRSSNWSEDEKNLGRYSINIFEEFE